MVVPMDESPNEKVSRERGDVNLIGKHTFCIRRSALLKSIHKFPQDKQSLLKGVQSVQSLTENSYGELYNCILYVRRQEVQKWATLKLRNCPSTLTSTLPLSKSNRLNHNNVTPHGAGNSATIRNPQQDGRTFDLCFQVFPIC